MPIDSLPMTIKESQEFILNGLPGISDTLLFSDGMWILMDFEAAFIAMTYSNGTTFLRCQDINDGPRRYDCKKEWLTQIKPITLDGEQWLETAAAISCGLCRIGPGLSFIVNSEEYQIVKYMGKKIWEVRNFKGEHFKISTAKIRNYLT